MAPHPPSTRPSPPRFPSDGEFARVLRARVDERLASSGCTGRDSWRMALKVVVILMANAACYGWLVFGASTWWEAIPLSIAMGLCMAGIGFGIQHDGGHKACSSRDWINTLCAGTLDLIGASSYLWKWKHGILHHQYTNIEGVDSDIELGIFGRLAPSQPRLPHHRWQHIYLWPLYGFLTLKWKLFDDFRDMAQGRIGRQPVPRPKGMDLALFLTGKALYLGLALALPLSLHKAMDVLPLYVLAELVLGATLSVVFQLAHAVELAEFPTLPDDGRLESGWMAHQLRTTVNFSPRSSLVTWLVGGLNHQVEHHLFPRICHVHYPALSEVVERTCREHGILYRSSPTFAAGLASHYRWLRRMGKGDAV